MTKPVRIQRKRSKGWKMPAGTVYVGRRSAWGNPWRVGEPIDWLIPEGGKGPLIPTEKGSVVTPEIAVAQFRIWVSGGAVKDIQADLRGKNLACWCPLDKPCHADVLLELANR